MEILQNEYISIALIVLLGASEALGSIAKFKSNGVLSLVVELVKLLKSRSQKLIIIFFAVTLIGCISTNLTRKENLETNLANAEVILAVADSMIYTEKLDAEYQEDVDAVIDIIADTRFLIEDGLELQALKTWQEGALLMIELNNKIYDAKNK